MSLQAHLHAVDYWGIARRNIWTVFICLLVSAAITVLAFLLLPKKFKASAVIDIQSSYFRTPLVGDLISEVWDPGEVKAQRLTLLRLAINDAFLEKLGEEFHLFSSPEKTSARALEKERLRSRIEYFSVGSTSYQISASAGHARQAYEITQAVLKQVQRTLVETRKKNLMHTRDVIQKHAEELDAALGTFEMGDKGGLTSPRELKQQLAAVLGNIEALSTQFSNRHPRMQELKRKQTQIERELEALSASGVDVEGSARDLRTQIGKQGKKPTQEVYFDLLRKLSYLNVVIDMEQESAANMSSVNVVQEPLVPIAPLSPNPAFLAAFGLLFGLISALIVSLYLELKRGTFQSPRYASNILRAPYLGSLPVLYSEKKPKLLEGGSGVGAALLPYSERS